MTGRHRVPGSRWWHVYLTEWRNVLLVATGAFGWVTVEFGWRPWWALGLTVLYLLPIPVGRLRRVPPTRSRGSRPRTSPPPDR